MCATLQLVLAASRMLVPLPWGLALASMIPLLWPTMAILSMVSHCANSSCRKCSFLLLRVKSLLYSSYTREVTRCESVWLPLSRSCEDRTVLLCWLRASFTPCVIHGEYALSALAVLVI